MLTYTVLVLTDIYIVYIEKVDGGKIHEAITNSIASFFIYFFGVYIYPIFFFISATLFPQF